MSSRALEKEKRREARLKAAAEAARAERARTLRIRVFVALGAAVAVLAVIFALSAGRDNAGSGSGSAARGGGAAGQFKYAVGDPGPGAQAPPLRLASTSGGEYDLGRQKGKRVLLYFQEGVGCQPCWDQIKDLEKDPGQLRSLGIDQMVTITGNELDDLRQKVADEKIKTPALADPGLNVSQTYSANQYGMMGDSANGHSFLVVGADGRIEFRADYGGSPDYTMYVPVRNLIADLKAGLAKAPAGT